MKYKNLVIILDKDKGTIAQKTICSVTVQYGLFGKREEKIRVAKDYHGNWTTNSDRFFGKLNTKRLDDMLARLRAKQDMEVV